ncbi:hypothetical protein [Staphylococcus phage vB_ScaM-V1SC04]|nr:hypothetical protein [Staphylococcus phage vB_ScaM-V1SC04]
MLWKIGIGINTFPYRKGKEDREPLLYVLKVLVNILIFS